MKHVHYSDVDLELPNEEGIKDLKVRWLISKNDGAKNFAMRLFEIKPGGYSPLHQHNWEHEVFIIQGEGVAQSKMNEENFKEGDVFLSNLWNGISLKIQGKKY
jgi:quercetin dioxygenase-like cupin family protein